MNSPLFLATKPQKISKKGTWERNENTRVRTRLYKILEKIT